LFRFSFTGLGCAREACRADLRPLDGDVAAVRQQLSWTNQYHGSDESTVPLASVSVSLPVDGSARDLLVRPVGGQHTIILPKRRMMVAHAEPCQLR